MSDTEQDEPPRVFVSYSHDSEDHRDRVRLLVEALRKSYIEAWFDQYVEDEPPGNWPVWMRQELRKANFVIMVCTETYTRRVEDREESGRGLGARWEGAIITNDLYTVPRLAETSSYMPVIFDADDREHIPYFVAQATHYLIDPETADGVERLVRRIKGRSVVTPIPLGGLPDDQPKTVHRRTQDTLPPVSDSATAEVSSNRSKTDRDAGESARVMVLLGSWPSMSDQDKDEALANLTAAERQVLDEQLPLAAARGYGPPGQNIAAQVDPTAPGKGRQRSKHGPHPLGEIQDSERKRLRVEQTDLDLEAVLFDALAAAPGHTIGSDVLYLHLTRISEHFSRIVSRQLPHTPTVMVEIWDLVRENSLMLARCLASPNLPLFTTRELANERAFRRALKEDVYSGALPSGSSEAPTQPWVRTLYAFRPPPGRGTDVQGMGLLSIMWPSAPRAGSQEIFNKVVGRHVADRLGYILAAVPQHSGGEIAADRWTADAPARKKKVVDMLTRANEDQLPADVRHRLDAIRSAHGDPQTPEQAEALSYQLEREIANYWAVVNASKADPSVVTADHVVHMAARDYPDISAGDIAAMRDVLNTFSAVDLARVAQDRDAMLKALRSAGFDFPRP